MHRGAGLAVAALVAVLLLPSGAMGAKRAPDLVESSVAYSSADVVPGAILTLSDTARNRGRRSSGRSVTGYYLSHDRRLDGGDAVLATRGVAPLKRGKRSSGSAGVTMPEVEPAEYFLLACADARRKIKESNERNNCRAGAPLTVRPPVGADAGPSGGPGGGPAGPGGGAGAAPGGDSGSPPAGSPGGPLSLSPQLAAGHAVKATIGRYGGTMSATGPDGSVFTLEIPEDALLGQEEITMTPVESLEGLPFSGGLGAAVQLEPDGLRLMNPATLTIQAARTLGPAELTPFAYRGDGAEFHMYPLLRDPARVAFPLVHFSGYGTGSATDEERERQLATDPTAPEDDRNQELADPLRDERECQLAGTSCRSEEELSELLRAALAAEYPGVVAAVEGAADDTQLGMALARGFGWIRNTQLFGLEDDFADQAAALDGKMWNAVAAAYERAFASCKQFDMSAPTRMLSLLRLAALLGREAVLDGTKLDRCLSFELDFQSDITLTNLDTGARSRASATLSKVQIKPYFLHPIGTSCPGNSSCGYSSGQIGNWEYVPSSNSTDTYSLVSGGLSVQASVDRPPVPNVREGSSFGPPKLRFQLRMGLGDERVEVTDADGNTTTRDMAQFPGLLVIAHSDTSTLNSLYGWFVTTVETGSTRFNRTVELSRGFGDERLVENTTITLTHAPN